jgi:predicted transcriptional regulator
MDKGQLSQDDFGTFLSSINRAIKDDHNTSQTSIQIVRYLSHTHGARVETILTRVRASYKEFNHGLEELSAAGLIRLEDDDEGSIIELTEEGQRWAQSMRVVDHDDDDDDEAIEGNG